MDDKQYNFLKLVSYILLSVGVISLPVDFPYHLIIGSILVVIAAIGSGIANFLTAPDTIVGGATNVAQAIVKAVKEIKAEEAKPSAPTVDPEKVIAAIQIATDKAIAEYKRQIAEDAIKAKLP
jgi:hypothetical protein